LKSTIAQLVSVIALFTEIIPLLYKKFRTLGITNLTRDMKNIITSTIFAGIIVLFCAFNILHSGGEAGATGSPGEGSCTGCHGGGPSVTTVSISATPAFTNNSFDPLTNYTITVAVSNPSLSAFGFDCEILGAGNSSIGTMTNAGTGVQFATAFNGRKNATHTTPKSGGGGASWTFQWLSPASGNATFYAAGNSVNLDGGTSGDRVGTTSLALSNINTALTKNPGEAVHGISVFPNPATDLASVSYYLSSEQNLNIELTDISGKAIKTIVNEKLQAGPHSNIIDLKGISKGIYFIKTSSAGEKISQKLISVQ